MKIRNIIFYVRDINKSKNFYKQLDFKIKQDFGKFVSYDVESENQFFSIMEADNVAKIPGKQVCAFWIDDINSWYQKLLKLKVKIETKLYKASFGKTFAIRDIDGNKIEFIQN